MDKRKNPPRRPTSVNRARPATMSAPEVAAADAIAQALHAPEDYRQHPPVPEVLATGSMPRAGAGQAIHPEDVSELALRTAIQVQEAPNLEHHATASDPVASSLPHATAPVPAPHSLEPQGGSRDSARTDPSAGLLALQATMLDLAVSSMTFWTDLMMSRWPKVSGQPTSRR